MAGRKRLALLLPDMRGGGAERVALNLCHAFVEAGHDVDLVLLAAEGELLPLVPREVRVFELGSKRLRGALLPFFRYLRRRRPDAVQVSMWPLTVIGLLAHRLARSPARILVSDHSALSKHIPPSAGLAHRLLKASVRLFYPLADARILVSGNAAEDMARFSGLKRDQLDVIYNPVREPGHPSAGFDLEALWGRERRSRILTVGTLKEQKNHALLIRAFARLRRRRPACLMIVGEGRLRGDLECLAATEGVADDVIMPGFFTDPWPFYASADLFVLSSDYEGFGNVIVEAMHCGTPVVSTDCEAGPREILDGGRYGALVPCNDAGALAEAMLVALSQPVDKTVLQSRAKRISGKEVTSDRYLELMIGRS